MSANIVINGTAIQNYVTVQFGLPYYTGSNPVGVLQSLHITLSEERPYDLIYIESELFTSIPSLQNRVGPLLVTQKGKTLTFAGSHHISMNIGMYTRFTVAFYDANMQLIPIDKCALNMITYAVY